MSVAIGIFDGMHLGHQFIIKNLVRFAKRAKSKSVVITFFPHPAKEESLLSLGHRLKLIRSLGVDICAVIFFTKKFSQVSAEEFVKNILVKKFNPRAVFVGENFTFGKNARGNVKLLKDFSVKYDFSLNSMPMQKVRRRVISSTRIRSLIKKGKIEQAQNLLGRRVAVLGTVIRGSGLGRLLGVPTANVNPHHEVLPGDGVYAVRINLNGKTLRGVCFIGKVSILKNRPARIEAHIFNFRKKIYGKDLEILFVKRMRNTRRYASKEQLIGQIKKDIKKAKIILK